MWYVGDVVISPLTGEKVTVHPVGLVDQRRKGNTTGSLEKGMDTNKIGVF